MMKALFVTASLVAGMVMVLSGGCAKKSANTPGPIPPVVTTNPAAFLSQVIAQGGGTVISEGSGSVTSRGVCYCIAPKMPTLADRHTSDGSGAGTFVSTLDQLTGDTVYFVRAYATSGAGTSYGEKVSFYSNATPPPFYCGEDYGGGVIFYLDGTGHHGLIAPTTEYSAPWGCIGFSIPTSVSLGKGGLNTAGILAGCNEKTIAAKMCTNLVINGKSDWFLPSKEELRMLYLKKDFVGDLGNENYWSSSQYDANQAYSINFADGTVNTSQKNAILWFRGVRAF